MVAVTGSRPGSAAIDEVVGDRDAVAGECAEDDVLSSDERSSHMIDPDHIGIVDGDGIAAPDERRVELRDLDVLDDDVACAADNTQALSLEDTPAAHANEALVRLDDYAESRRVVVGDTDRRRTGLVVVTPVVLVDGLLAGCGSAIWRTTGLGSGALGAGEVEGGADVDVARGGISEVRDQLSGGGWVDGCCRAAASYALCEAFGSSRDGGGTLPEESSENAGEEEALHCDSSV